MNRKSLRVPLYLTLLVLIMCAGYVSAATNLLVNPSFEEVDQYGELKGWRTFSSSPMIVGVSVSSDVVVTGKNSLLCSLNYTISGKPEAIVLQEVPVKKNTLYKVGFKYRKENYTEKGPLMTIQIWDGFKGATENNIVYIEPLIMQDHNKIDDPMVLWEDQGYRVMLKDLGSSVLAEDEWVEHWAIIKTNDKTEAIHIAVGIKSNNPNNTGKVYFDDIYIEEFQ